MTTETPKIPPHTYLTGAVLIAGLVGNWALMQYQVDQHGNNIAYNREDIRMVVGDINELKIRAAEEDGRDSSIEQRAEDRYNLLEQRVDYIEQEIRRRYNGVGSH